jgi:chorismate mutase
LTDQLNTSNEVPRGTRLRAYWRGVRRLIAVALLTGCTAAAFGQSADSDSALTTLVALTSQRLAYAEPVARWRLAHDAVSGVTGDPAGANVQLADAIQRATAAGIDPGYARLFFADQAAAMCEQQDVWLARWRSAPASSAAAPDLTDASAHLTALTPQLVAALSRAARLRNAPDCPARLARSLADWKMLSRYDGSRADALDTALGHVCTAGGASAVG